MVLGETVEDDIFLLVKDRARDEHVAVAFVCCHPSGFDPAEKLGKGLAAIHGPVPSYERIGESMERFFSRLEAGKRMKRVNVGYPFFFSGIHLLHSQYFFFFFFFSPIIQVFTNLIWK